MPNTDLTVSKQDEVKSEIGLFFKSNEEILSNALSGTTVDPDRIKSACVNAVIRNPKLLSADKGSFLSAVMQCASDGLIPDDREATLQIYNSKTKDPKSKKEVWIEKVQYMPMVQGIRKRARELGGIKSIISSCVHENDEFDYAEGDNPYLNHKAAKLGKPRGKIVGVYAIFKNMSDDILHREVMDKETVDKIRKASKSPDSPAWKNWYDQMSIKCVVRRGSKSVPSLPDSLRTIIERDDVNFDFSENPKVSPTVEHNPLISERQTQSALPSPDTELDASLGSGIGKEAEPVEASTKPQPSTGSVSTKSQSASSKKKPEFETKTAAHISYITKLHAALGAAPDEAGIDAVLKTYRENGDAPFKGDGVFDEYNSLARAHRDRVLGKIEATAVDAMCEEMI